MSISILEIYRKVQEYLKENGIHLMPYSDLNYLYNLIQEHIITNNIHFFLEEYKHKLYPIITVDMGKPNISSNRCCHYGCYEEFKCNDDLINHLRVNNAYNFSYTASHNIYGNKYYAKMDRYYCASRVCNFSTHDENEIKRHLKLLGVEPYYKKGDKLSVDEYIDFFIKNHCPSYYNNINRDDINNMIYTALQMSINSDEKCYICKKNNINTFILECQHKVLCSSCSSSVLRSLVSKKCPLCNCGYKNIIILT